ncbi:MAG: hypothetical protein V7L31_24035 [Nostoc sp.]|uniref:hypothetical protein n=1 Tax=Nostoc sp. TaxID=1180 RepID=UPI002FEFC0C3
MSKDSVSIEIALKEQRHDFVCNSLAQVMTFLEGQGFTFDEVLDGLVNYAWMKTDSIDAVCFLMQASLSVAKAHKLEEKDVTS